MQIIKNAVILAAAASTAQAVTLAYDETYDNGAGSLSTLACSDGVNGLTTRYGWTTLGQIPDFPNVGAAAAVAGWNSPSCGTCWKLTYNGRSINVLAVDHAGAGFNIALAAMNTLTNGQATMLGRVEVDAVQVAAADCGVA